jgi:hypothetical protein
MILVQCHQKCMILIYYGRKRVTCLYMYLHILSVLILVRFSQEVISLVTSVTTFCLSQRAPLIFSSRLARMNKTAFCLWRRVEKGGGEKYKGGRVSRKAAWWPEERLDSPSFSVGVAKPICRAEFHGRIWTD